MYKARVIPKRPKKAQRLLPGTYVVTHREGCCTTNDGYLFCMRQGQEFAVVSSNESTTTTTINNIDGAHFWTGTIHKTCEPVKQVGQLKLSISTR